MRWLAFVVIITALFQSRIYSQGFYKKIDFGGKDIPQGAIIMPNNDIIICSYAQEGTDWVSYISRLDKYGNKLWSKTFNGPKQDLYHDIDTNLQGNLILSGRTWSYLSMGGDAILSSIDENGNELFTTVIDGYQYYYNASLAAAILSSGEIIQIGRHHMFFNPVRYDWEINRIDPYGQVINSYVVGKINGDDEAFDVLAIDSANYLVCGLTESLTTGDNISLLYADTSDSIHHFLTFEALGEERAYNVFINNDSTIFLAGYSNSFGAGDYDFCLIKLDVNLNLIWSKVYGGTEEDILKSACLDGMGGIILGGSTESFNAQGKDNLIIHVNNNGNVIKSIHYGGVGDDIVESVSSDLKGTFILQSSSNSYSQSGLDDIIIVKTDTSLFPRCKFDEVNISVGNAPFNLVTGASQSFGVTSSQNVNHFQNDAYNYSDTSIMPSLDAGIDFSLCTNDSAFLSAIHINIDSFYWNRNVKDSVSFYPLADSLDYIVSGKGFDCFVKDTVHIYWVSPASPIIYNQDTSIFYGSGFQINSFLGSNYNWTPSNSLDCSDCQYPFASPHAPTLYKLSMRDSNNCLSHDSIYVDIIFDSGVFIPSAFSPNNDGVNDYLKPRIFGLLNYRLLIYNRWGKKVFETTDPKQSWNGNSLKNNALNTDVFTYFVFAEYQNQTKKVFKGNITLVR